MSQAVKQTVKTYGVLTLGALVYALAFAWCYQPNQIGFGGLTGLSQIIHRFVPALPVGTMVAVGNVPLFWVGWRVLGGRALATSLYAMVCTSLFIDVLDALVPFSTMEPMLASVTGGVVLGVGLGLVFLQGASTGGTDLLARLVKRKVGWLPLGQLLLCIDMVIIVAVAVAFRSLESGLYGLIALFLSTVVLDKMLYGLDTSKVAYIISAKPREVTEVITGRLERGVTLLAGKGGWSGQDKQVLLCAFKQRQIVALKAAVREVDAQAFLIVCNAYEVLGDGFAAAPGDN